MPDVAKVVGANVSKILESGHELVERAQHDLGPSAGSLIEDRAERTRATTSNAATAAAGFGRDTVATILWTAISAAVIYFGILDERQREKARAAWSSVLTSCQEIIRDLQGEDERF